MQDDTRKTCLQRLGRIEGQVRGIARMVEDDRYCIDVLNQLLAVRAALKKVEAAILEDHVGHCVAHALESGGAGERDAKMRELMAVLGRYAGG